MPIGCGPGTRAAPAAASALADGSAAVSTQLQPPSRLGFD